MIIDTDDMNIADHYVVPRPLGIDPDDEFYGIDWSKIDKPVKLTVTERVDIDNLQAFAGSEEVLLLFCSSEMPSFLLAGVSY